ncbi:MAG: T9SS type A sorting domain-containing protein [Candidatus Hatepunaea meridiana]|nr:T9SS type A sorting domain-containing protein [Candidatus Hatepunaea meridiana]
MAAIQIRDGGFVIGTSDWNGDQDCDNIDYSIIKTDSLGFVEWREFYTLIPDTIEADELVYDIKQLPDGDYVLVGSGPGGSGAMIVRTDSAGEMLWSRYYSYREFASFSSCALADEDNVVLVNGSSIAAKINLEEGDVVWRRSYVVDRSGILYQLAKANDGGFLLTGTITSIGEGSGDMYAVKIDSDGEVEWRNTYGTEYYEVITNALQTADDGYCLVGQSLRNHAHFGMIVRTDSEGEEIWRQIYTNEEEITLGSFNTVVEAPDGGFAMGLYTGGDNVRLSRVNSGGEFIWSALYPVGGGQYRFYSLLLMEDFGYVLGGFASGDWLIRTEPDELSESAWDLQASEDDHDFGGVPLDSVQIWELTLTNEGQQPVEVLDITTDSVAFSVEFEDILTLEPDEEASIPLMFTPTDSIAYTGALTIHTYWRDVTVELSGTGVALSAPEEPNVLHEYALYSVYPNPFNLETQISYSLPVPSDIILTIYDIYGRRVQNLISKRHEAGHYQAVWQGEGIPTGMYFLRLEAGDFIQTRKIMLLK